MAIDARRLAARALVAVEAAVACATALVLLAVGAALVIERGGWLEARVREELERRTDGGVALDRVRIDWRRPALVAEGVRLARAPDALRIARVAVEPRLGDGPWWQIVASGGGARIGAAFERELARVVEALEVGGEPDEDEERAVRWPAVTWTDVEVVLAPTAGRAQPLGSLDLWLRPTDDGGGELSGLARPWLGAGAPLEPIALRGVLRPEGVLDAQLAARHVEVPAGALAEHAWLGDTGISGLHGTVSLAARAHVPLTGGPPAAELDVVLDDLGWTSADPLFAAQGTRVRGRVAFHPKSGASANDADAWSGEWRVSSHWNGGPIDVGVELGRTAGPGKLARLDLVVPSTPLGDPTTLRTVRACTGPDTARAIGEAWDALEPGGVAALVLAAELDAEPPRRAVADGDGDGDGPKPRVHFHVDLAGTSTLRYVGWPQDDGGVQGFPVPLRDVGGKLVFSHEPGDLRRDRFGLIGVRATPPSGAVTARGSICSRDPSWPEKEPEIRLAIDIDDLDVATDVATGLAGLDLGFDPLAACTVSGGRASGDLRFEQHPRNGGMRLALDVDFAGLAAELADWGVALRSGAGRMALRFARAEVAGDDGQRHRPTGVAFAAVGALAPLGAADEEGDGGAAPRAALRGTWRERGGGAEGSGTTARDEWFGVELAIDGAALDGDAVRSFARARGAGGLVERDALRLRGTAGLRGSLARPPRAPGHVALHVAVPVAAADGLVPWPLAGWRVDANARGELDPLAWISGTADAGDGARWHVHGRAAGVAAEGTRGAVALRVLDGAPLFDFAAAGVDPDAPRLRTELAALAGAPPVDDDDALLPAGFALSGRFDVHGTLAAVEGDAEPYVVVDLRHARLAYEPVALESLSGRVVLAGGSIGAARLDTRFGDTALVLEDLSLGLRDDDGAWRGAPPTEPHPADADTRALLRTRVSFVDLPVDSTRFPARGAPPDAAEDELVEGIGPAWRGELDAHGVSVEVALGRPQGPIAWISGDVVPHDVRILSALPIGISSARVRLERVVVEDGDARGWGRVHDLYANVAGRAIADGSLVATYAAGRLTVDDVVAGVAGGTVAALGSPLSSDGDGAQGGRALAVDLVEGGRFELGIALRDLHVRELLEGLVQGVETTAGRVDGELRIAGMPRDPATLRGSGRIAVDRARLGSIPVARAVFTALGFDATATFDRGVAEFTLSEAVLRLDELVVRSPLLKLVGEGTVGLDGRLEVDLDVEYAVVDALGVFGSLVYWLQNQLLRVSVRGDLARPSVRARNVLLDLVGDGTEDLPLLPLPALPPLPARF